MLEYGKILEQIFTQAMSYIQLIIAALLLLEVILGLIHIRQTRKISKKISYAGLKIQQYLDAVFDNEEEVEVEEEEEAAEEDKPVQLEVLETRKSQQEENMRVSLEHKKQRKDGELMDTVLQEIFD